jgi:carbonic anhydrase
MAAAENPGSFSSIRKAKRRLCIRRPSSKSYAMQSPRTIDVGCSDDRVPVTAEMIGAVLIGDDQEKIGS